MNYRNQLRDLAVQGLIAAQTLAGSNVFAPRDWPTNGSIYPSILVQAYRERKESRAKGSQLPQFIATVILSIEGRLQVMGTEAAAGTAQSQLDTLIWQIESAVLCNQSILQSINRVSFVDMDSGVTASGREHIAQVQLNFGLELPVDIDPVVDRPAAWPPLYAPLTNVQLTYEQPAHTTEPGLNITLPQS